MEPRDTGANMVTITLDAAQHTSYANDGFTAVPNCARDSELAELRTETDRLFALAPTLDDHAVRVQTRTGADGAPVVDRIDPVADLSALLRDYAASGPLAALAAAALGEPARVMKEKLVLRPSGAEGYAPHQDITFWRGVPAPPESMLTIGLAIDDCTPENGAIEFWAGLATRDWVEGPIDGIFGRTIGNTPSAVLEGRTSHLVPLRAGDAVVFNSLAPHHSAPNRSASHRRMYLVSYAAERYGDLRPIFYKNFQASIRSGAS